MEASNIFSFGAFKDCNDINLRIDNNKKRFANNTFELENTAGNNIKNNMKKSIV